MAPERKQTKSEKTRARILACAAKVFRQHGYTSASLRDIAEVAGIQAGSLYYHFDGKEELAEAVLDEGVLGARKAADEAIAALGDDANPLERIEAAFRGHLSYMLAEADFAVASLRMLHQTPDAVRTRHMRKQRALGRFYAGLFEEARDAGLIRPEYNLSALRMLLIGALNWSPEWYDPSGLSADQLVSQLSQMMLKGIMPENVTLAPRAATKKATRS